MEKQTFNQWVEVRETHRESLFGETMHEAVETDMTSLARLALSTSFHSYRTMYDRMSEVDIQLGVKEILKYHNRTARQETEGAVFAIVDDQALSLIAALTAKLISNWEYAGKKQGYTSPFEDLPIRDIEHTDFERKDVQLVIEIAAAAAEIITRGPGFSVHNRLPKDDQIIRLASFATRYGPRFADDIVSGKFVREYCEKQAYDTNKWLRYLSGSHLIYSALRNNTDPTHWMRRTIDHYEIFLSTEQIAKYLGWDKQRVERVFVPSFKLEIAKRANSLKTLDRISYELDNDLSTTNLSKVLGWPEEKATEVFSEFLRMRIILSHTKPLEYIIRVADAFSKTLGTENLMRELGLTKAQAESLFSPVLRKKIAQRKNPIQTAKKVLELSSELSSQYGLPQSFTIQLAFTNKAARRIAQVVQRDIGTPPRGISPTYWMWVIARAPYSTKKRLSHIQAYLLCRNIQSPMSLDAPRYGEAYNVVANGQTYDPAEMFDMSEPSEFLYDLAGNAGVSDAELSSLLAQFTEKDIEEFGADDLATLQKLRQAAA